MAKTREPSHVAIDASHRHRRHHEASSTIPAANPIPHRTDKESKPITPAERHRPARRHEGRGERRSEAIRHERRSERQSGKQREAGPHDGQMTGRVSTMGQTEATPNTDDETTSPTRQASRNERDTRRTAEAPRKRERENQRNPIELTPSMPSAARAVLTSSPPE